MYQLVAEGNAKDISQLDSYESQYREGDRGYLDIQLAYSPSSDIISKLDDILRTSGARYRLEAYKKGLLIHFRKAVAPLAIIAGAIAAVILILGLLVAWKLYRLKPEVVIGWTIGAIVAIVLVAVAVTAVVGAVKGR